MFINKGLVIVLFIICALLLIPVYSYSQPRDSLLGGKDSIEVNFQKVLLDGDLAYQNRITGNFLTQMEYVELRKSIVEEEEGQDDSYNEPNQTYDYWDNEKVNPYTNVNLPTPFNIQFNQTTFTHPVDGDIVITSRFGRRRRGPHRGLDIDLVTGDSVRCVLPGRIRFVGYSSGHGKTVVVRHANEVETVYAHLSAYLVEPNDSIAEGQILGLGGNTGNSRGSHLHLEVRYQGVCIHPEYVFNFDGSRTIWSTELWVTNAWKSPRFHSSYRKSEVEPLFTEQEAIASQNAEPRYHRVRRGDTLSHIAQRYHLGLRELCRLNSISTKSILRIGQIIQVR
jgi:murein DD-endopeptidase MepM/ murein hydrolase activator NlpD